jgi:hypothetical protein
METLYKREKTQLKCILQTTEPSQILSFFSSRSRKSGNMVQLTFEYKFLQLSLFNFSEQKFHFPSTGLFPLSQLFFQNLHHQLIIDPLKFYPSDSFIQSDNHFLHFTKILNTLSELDHLAMNKNLITLLKQLIFEPCPTNNNSSGLLISNNFPPSFRSFYRKQKDLKQIETLMLCKLEAITNPFFLPFIIPLKHLINNTFPGINSIRIQLQATNKLTEMIFQSTRNQINFSLTKAKLISTKLNFLFQYPTSNFIRLTKSFMQIINNDNKFI